MQHNKTKYFVEPIIHALFWLGVYYTLSSLIAASFSMVSYNNGKPTGGFSGNMLFPYPQPVLGVLMVMFYGNIFWLFKKVIRYKNNFGGVLVIAGWFVLLFVVNYLVIRMLADPSGGNHYHRKLAFPDNQQKISFSVKPVPGASSDSIHLPNVHLSPSPPPPPPEMAFTVDDWRDMQLVMSLIFLSVLGVAVAYFFIKQWIRNDLARSQAEAQQLSTEIKFLKSQINPHFLFNTLNNLFSMAQEKGNDGLADSISKLSGMMRYMVYDSNAASVPLTKEIKYLEDCIALNKLRYADDEVSVMFHYPEQSGSVTIAPMLFIPFVENAFKHGVSIGKTSVIDIGIVISGHRLIFTCLNTNYSTVKKMEDEKSGIGLENVKRRLDLLYPGKHHLQITEDDGKYIVKLEIDLE